MAGPITRRFVEAIEWTVANEVVQLARNRPKHLVLFVRGFTRPLPFIMVTKYDEDMTDRQFKLRIWEDGVLGFWNHVEIIFTSTVHLATFVVDHYPQDCDPDFILGCKCYSHWPVINIATYYELDKFSTAIDWLHESDYIDEYAEIWGVDNLEEIAVLVEVFDDLVESEIGLLVTLYLD
jgi:hypothetical protein